MIRTLAVAGFCFGLASATSAGEVAPYVPQPTVMVGPIENHWAGLYVGGSVNYSIGEMLLIDSDVLSNTFEISPTFDASGFAGYNLQFGHVVVGGELAYSSAGQILSTLSSFNYGPIADAKVKIGYSFGKSMVYGFAGYSVANVTDNITVSAVSGMSYGAGFSKMVSSRVFVGAEYIFRNIDGLQSNDPGVLYETNMQAIQIRIGLQF